MTLATPGSVAEAPKFHAIITLIASIPISMLVCSPLKYNDGSTAGKPSHYNQAETHRNSVWQIIPENGYTNTNGWWSDELHA